MRPPLLASLVGAVLVLSACGGPLPDGAGAGSSSDAPASASPSASGPAGSGQSAGPGTGGPDGPPPHPALAFSAPLLDGGTFTGAVSGDVALWFWAPW